MEMQTMPNDERNDESGRFASKYGDDEFLEAIDELGGAASTSEVTDAVGCPKRTAQHRLSTLRDDGQLTAREVGGAYLWQLVDEPDADADGHEPATDERAPDRRETAPATTDDASDADDTGSAHDAAGVRDDAETIVDDVAAGWDRDERLEGRRAAAVAVLEYAATVDEHVGRSTAVDEFHDEHPVDEQNAETWYRQNVRPVLQAVGDYSRGHHGYRVDRDELAERAAELRGGADE